MFMSGAMEQWARVSFHVENIFSMFFSCKNAAVSTCHDHRHEMGTDREKHSQTGTLGQSWTGHEASRDVTGQLPRVIQKKAWASWIVLWKYHNIFNLTTTLLFNLVPCSLLQPARILLIHNSTWVVSTSLGTRPMLDTDTSFSMNIGILSDGPWQLTSESPWILTGPRLLGVLATAGFGVG